MEAKHKSPGAFIVDDICVGHLTVPILARAMGYHLEPFTNELISGGTTDEFVGKLTEIMLFHAWTLNAQAPWYTREHYEGIITNYQRALPEDRIEVTLQLWEEPIATLAPDFDENPKRWQLDLDWLEDHPVLTLEAFMGSFPGYNRPVAVQRLHSCRWHVCSDRLWRWNPLKLVRSAGYTGSHSNPNKSSDLLAAITSAAKPGSDLISLSEVSLAYHGRKVSDSTNQKLRDQLTKLGLVYIPHKKKWQLPQNPGLVS